MQYSALLSVKDLARVCVTVSNAMNIISFLEDDEGILVMMILDARQLLFSRTPLSRGSIIFP